VTAAGGMMAAPASLALLLLLSLALRVRRLPVDQDGFIHQQAAPGGRPLARWRRLLRWQQQPSGTVRRLGVDARSRTAAARAV